MDFNQVSARGLKRMMRNVIRRSADKDHVDYYGRQGTVVIKSPKMLS